MQMTVFAALEDLREASQSMGTWPMREEVNMEYDEFKKEVKEIAGDKINALPDGFDGKIVNPDDADFLLVQWEVGGIAGGCCWPTTDPKPYTTAFPEAELDALDGILDMFSEHITFAECRQICGTVVRRGRYTIRGHYGNRTDYAFKYCLLTEVWGCLADRGIVQLRKTA